MGDDLSNPVSEANLCASRDPVTGGGQTHAAQASRVLLRMTHWEVFHRKSTVAAGAAIAADRADCQSRHCKLGTAVCSTGSIPSRPLRVESGGDLDELEEGEEEGVDHDEGRREVGVAA